MCLLFFVFSDVGLVARFEACVCICQIFRRVEVRRRIFYQGQRYGTKGYRVQHLYVQVMANLVQVRHPATIFVVDLVDDARAVVGVATLYLRLVSDALKVVVYRACVVVPAITFTDRFRPTFLPSILPDGKNFQDGSQGNATACYVRDVRYALIYDENDRSRFHLNVCRVSVKRTRSVNYRTTMRVADQCTRTRCVIVVIAVRVLRIVNANEELMVTVESSLAVFNVVGGPRVVGSTLILPRVVMCVAYRRRDDLAANVHVQAHLEAFRDKGSGYVLRVGQQAYVTTPTVAGFVRSRRYRIQLRHVLLYPKIASYQPIPKRRALFVLIIYRARGVKVIDRRIATKVVGCVLKVFYHFHRVVHVTNAKGTALD